MSDETQKFLDERLEKALESAKYRATLYTQKENSKLKYKQALCLAKNGGVFSVSQVLISFVYSLVQQQQSQAVIIDANDNPIYIDNLESFLEDITDRYYEASNEYLSEYKKLQAARKIAPMMDL